MLEHTGLTESTVVVFGDHMNDLEMFNTRMKRLPYITPRLHSRQPRESLDPTTRIASQGDSPPRERRLALACDGRFHYISIHTRDKL